MEIDRGKGLGNLLRERRIHIAMGREAAMTIAGTGPHDPQAVRGQGARLLQGLKRPVTHGSSIVFPLTHTRHHVLLAGQGAALTLLVEGTAGQIPLGVEPKLVQEIVTDGVSLLRTTNMSRMLQTSSTYFWACSSPIALPHWSA